MARSIVVQITCDICGAPIEGAASLLTFAVRGSAYEADLCETHAAAFDTALEPYVAVAQKSGRRTTQSTGTATRRETTPAGAKPPTRRDPEQIQAVRQWARENGFQVSDRGRIPAHIEEAYNKR